MSFRDVSRFALLLVVAACALALPPAGARAEVEYTVKWIPGDAEAQGFRVHRGTRSGAYTSTVDFGYVAPDADGIRRRVILLDETQDQYLAMDAYNGVGASQLSNEVVVQASACDAASCDDGNVCTVDGCAGESCTSTPVPDGTLCGSGGRVCMGGSCRVVECLSGGDCDDGNFCNGAERCGGGFRCLSGSTPHCGVATQCTVPACDPVLGCVTEDVPDNTPCDDARPTTTNDRCRAGVCRGIPIPACGDRRLDAGEECDDGNREDGDGCSGACLEEVCGNGRVDFGEACDDGNRTDGDGCEADCTVAGCGDGALDSGEACDDGNSVSGDGCDANCTVTACGNGVVTDGEVCDDGNLEEGDGCGLECTADLGATDKDERMCIVSVNRQVGKIARTQGRVNERCFADWFAGRDDRLGPAATFDNCIAADPEDRVRRDWERFIELEAEYCASEEPPRLALGPDRLAGLPWAAMETQHLMGDLFGRPASMARDVDLAVYACQRRVAKRAAKVQEAFWTTMVSAKAQKLKGRETPPARNDEELSAFIETALYEGKQLLRASEKLGRVVERACGELTDLGTHFAGCGTDDARGVFACANRAARCRACMVLSVSDPLLTIDCDALDNGLPDGSCLP